MRLLYITNIKQSVEILIQTADGGRLRWKIENQGFNTQKNNGYELGHKYSRVSYTALKNYYLILQVAHMINQLTKKSNDVINLVESHAE
jgi:DNA-binding IclR family transcriptional regulator